MIDRSRFSGAKLSANKDVQKQAAANNKSFSNGEGRVGFHSIEEGKNVFRIMPPHPSDTIGAAYLPYRTSMLPEVEVPVWKDGEKTDQTEIKQKKIFIATQHGGLPKDPIELYVEYVRKRASDEFQVKEDRQSFLNPITGWKDKKGTWNWGINPKTSFIAYAVKNKELKRLELYESMVKDMDKCAISEEPEDVMGVDPFSDPNEGCELIITKQKKLDKQGKETSSWEYPVTKGEPSRAKRESWDDYFERTMVTDEQLEELDKQEPLSKMIGNDVYTKRDWDFAMDGLRRFDEKNNFQIFDNDEFLEEIIELEKLVPEPKDKDDDVKEMFDKKKDSPKKEDKKKPEPKEEKEDDEDEITPADMKFALKKFIKKNYGEQYVDQIPSGKDLQKWYCLMEDGEDLPLKPEKEEKEDKKKEAVDTSKSIPEDKLDDQIQKLRARRANK
jgi:hypothetical protein